MTRYAASYLEALARDWQAWYAAANGKNAPAVVWEHGWFKVGVHRYRRRSFEAMRTELRNRVIKSTPNSREEAEG